MVDAKQTFDYLLLPICEFDIIHSKGENIDIFNIFYEVHGLCKNQGRKIYSRITIHSGYKETFPSLKITSYLLI